MFTRCASQGEVARELGMPRKTLVDYLNDGRNTELKAKCDEVAKSHKDELKGRIGPTATISGVGPDVTETDIDTIRMVAEQRFAAKHERAERKESQEIHFSSGPVALFFLGDQHIGNAGTDIKRMFAEQEMICSTPGAYVWQMGDGVDQFIVGRLIAENMKPSLPVWEQWQLYKHYLQQFEERLVVVNSGNHDFWAANLTGVDYAREICPTGILYDADEIRADVRVGEHVFKIWTRHKWNGGSKYNPTHALENAARFDSPRFDVMVGAHVHRGAVAREFTLDGERKMALMCGSYKIHDDYQKQVGFVRHDASTAVALVMDEDGTFWATSNLTAVLKYMNACYAA